MNNTLIIARKEIRTYLNSPASYVVLFVFLIISGWFFSSPLFLINQASLDTLFSIIPIIFVFFIPAITMSLISREKDSGTIESLTTFPLSDFEIISGKFLASVSLIIIGLIFTLIHLLTISFLGQNVDFGAIFCAYLGVILMGAAYSAIGIFSSTLSNNQIISFIIALLIIFFLFVLQFILFFLPSSLAEFFQFLSTEYHFSNLSRGIIDSRNIIYFGSLIAIFLKLATVIMETRKWK
ncbi:MAG: ABC transporter permease subunit [Candidatus Cloacimonetes bacterium]|jgi:ABC-2 type transport system permease protein|nr:ABC transporter permease subunit [Candidatus Cloacimonadota bacterium]